MFQWDPKMETGVAAIDRQHKELVRQVNELMTAMKEGRGRQMIGDVLAFLGKYAVEHFGTEEELMRKNGYPDYERHHAIHEAFKKDFGALAEELDANPVNLSLTLKVQNKVLDWLKSHILNIDSQVGSFLAAKGVH